MSEWSQPRFATVPAQREQTRPEKALMSRAILACAARHLYCAAGDLAIAEMSDPVERSRLDDIKARLRPLLVREAAVVELLWASPRIITAVGPAWTLLEALAAVLTTRRAHELDDAIDPSVVELATHYLKGVKWAFTND